MAESGNPNSVSDAGVGALCARTAVEGAFLNVKINTAGLVNKELKKRFLASAEEILHNARTKEKDILKLVNQKIDGQ
jgi:glutamate formiminotransferase/formiminotetrahydrofolate cyclodeaminase